MGVPAAFSPPGDYIVNSEQARQQAEKRFKHEQDGRKALAEYEADARATREKTARLRALRLAKEALAQKEATLATAAARPARRRK